MQPKAAAAPELVQANPRPSNTYAQRPQQGFAPPPAHQQKLMLCRYYESGKLSTWSPIYKTQSNLQKLYKISATESFA